MRHSPTRHPQGRGFRPQPSGTGWQLWGVTKGAGQGLPQTWASGACAGALCCPCPRLGLTGPSCRGGAAGPVCGGGGGRRAGRAMEQPPYLHSALPAQRDLQRFRHPRQGGTPPSRAAGGGRPGRWNSRGAALTPPSSQVKWVVGAILQKTPLTTHDYANVEPPAAWARGRSCTGPAAYPPATRRR